MSDTLCDPKCSHCCQDACLMEPCHCPCKAELAALRSERDEALRILGQTARLRDAHLESAQRAQAELAEIKGPCGPCRRADARVEAAEAENAALRSQLEGAVELASKAEGVMNLAAAYLDRVGTGDLSDPATGHAMRLQIAAGALSRLAAFTPRAEAGKGVCEAEYHADIDHDHCQPAAPKPKGEDS